MPRTSLTRPSPVEILEEPLDTIPSRELADPTVSRRRARRAAVDAVDFLTL